jgi:hypothetical protein
MRLYTESSVDINCNAPQIFRDVPGLSGKCYEASGPEWTIFGPNQSITVS